MATNSLRGDGLFQAHEALSVLEEDPQRLDHSRRRFSDSPPSYSSCQSRNSTLSQSPNPPSDEQRREEERRWQLIEACRASIPRKQFLDQCTEESERVLKGIKDRTLDITIGTNFHQIARDNVKNRWVEQGIWNEKWNRMADGCWKHEEPLELESESETEPRSVFSFSIEQPRLRQRRPKSDEEKWQMAQRRARLEREREASRPFNQFIYQVSKERERTQDETGNRKAMATTAPDINTTAYEAVKNTWIKRNIWNRSWGTLPGMFWKHEESVEQTGNSSASLQVNPPVNSSHEASVDAVNGVFARSFSGPPVTDLSKSGVFAPAEPNYRQASGSMRTFQRGDLANIDTAISSNSNVGRPPQESLPPRSQDSTRAIPHALDEAQERRKRKAGYEENQDLQEASASLGSVPQTKVSKAPRRQKTAPRRQSWFGEVLPGDASLLSKPDIAEPSFQADAAPSRRSKRLQLKESSKTKNSAGISSRDVGKDVSRSTLKRIAGTNFKSIDKANPQGKVQSGQANPVRRKRRKRFVT